MTVGIISDTHANLPALERVLEDMPDVDRIICCGDIVGYGPYPKACIDVIRDVSDLTIVGNHDVTVLRGQTYNSTTARHGIEFAKQRLYQEDYEWLDTLSGTAETEELQVVHSHPNPDNIAHVYAGRIKTEFSQYFERDIFIYGHTHEPVNTVVDETLVVNPGSVGQPRDGDPRASYAVLDTEDVSCELQRVEYDIDRTVEKLREENFPPEMVERLQEGR